MSQLIPSRTYMPTGAGVIAATLGQLGGRTISVLDRMTDAEREDVLSGAGTLEVTAAIQATINYVETLNWPVTEKGRPAISLPSGKVYSDGVSSTKNITIIGAGDGATFWQLKAGSVASLLTLGVENVAGTSVDDANHSVVIGLTLRGNRTDNVTTGASRGISCPAPAWDMATQYSTAFIGEDLDIAGFTGDGIYLGVNRNWAMLNRVIVRYCNDNGLATYGYDHEISNSSFGVNKNFGVRGYAGGMNVFTACAIFWNDINVVLNASVDQPFQFNGGSNDGALRQGLVANGSAGFDMHSLNGVRFSNNSRTGANLYADITIDGPELVQVVGCQFVKVTQKTKYLVEALNGSKVAFVGAIYDASGGATSPYQTAITNDVTAIIWSGDTNAHFGPVGPAVPGVYVGAAVVAKWSAAESSRFVPDRVQSAVPKHIEDESDQAVDGRIWMRQINGGVMQWFVANDAESVFVPFFKVTRAGNTVARVEFPSSPVGLTPYAKAALPPAAGNAYTMIFVTDEAGGPTPAFGDGTNWRRVADRAIVS